MRWVASNFDADSKKVSKNIWISIYQLYSKVRQFYVHGLRPIISEEGHVLMLIPKKCQKIFSMSICLDIKSLRAKIVKA